MDEKLKLAESILKKSISMSFVDSDNNNHIFNGFCFNQPKKMKNSYTPQLTKDEYKYLKDLMEVK